MMVSVGVIGLGVMGRTHLDAYAGIDRAHVVAVADLDASRLSGLGDISGNIEGQSRGGYDLSLVKKYVEGMDLVADPSVDLVDICLTTPLHEAYAIAALKAGKHLLVEKPVARDSDSARRIVQAASNAPGRAMCALCMRFWPGWSWLKDVVETNRYGSVRSAVFRRISEHPGGAFYSDGRLSGGGLLDLHIHDTDFICHLFGVPSGVTSRGYDHGTGCIDHVTTFYDYPDVPHVVAEGGWSMSKGFGFVMQYTVRFERATAVFQRCGNDSLMLHEDGKPSVPVPLDTRMGYTHEIEYLIKCIEANMNPELGSLESATQSLMIVEAEAESVRTGKPTAVTRYEPLRRRPSETLLQR
jgi:predicted dehydrogenase